MHPQSASVHIEAITAEEMCREVVQEHRNFHTHDTKCILYTYCGKLGRKMHAYMCAGFLGETESVTHFL